MTEALCILYVHKICVACRIKKNNNNLSQNQSQSYFTTDGRSVSQSVCLGFEPTLEHVT
jgi:hypothetical protein